ncbi:MAG: P-loop NTPase, partial [Muribaculaceae bacterium]|nr:P-loop NTPase [Muribaculaceae bacterium]
SNLNNELVTITAPSVMYEVVKRLGIDVGYSVSGRFHDTALYGPSLPLRISFPDLKENESASLTATLRPDGSVVFSGFKEKDSEGKTVPSDKTVSLASLAGIDTLATPNGRIVVAPNPAYIRPEEKPAAEIEINVTRPPLKSSVARYTAELSAEIPEDTRIIAITCKDENINRAEDLLTAVTEVYNENWIRDKNRVSVSTAEFIKERLAVIENELGNVDSDISSYKSAHMVPDLAQASQLYFTRASEASDEVLDLNNRLGMARYLRDYLANSANTFNVLPANAGLQNLSVESQIAEYNKLLLSRNNLVENSSDSNPIVVDLDSQLEGMRQAIVQSIDNYIVTLNASVRAAEASQAAASSRLAANPGQARYLLSVERQQKVKESLYLYLLQKREENELNQAFTAYNSRVITPPSGPDPPVAPNSRNILIMAFLLGMAVPMGLVWLSETLNTKVRGRKDIEKLSVPFLGEIPLGYKRRKGLKRLRPARPDERDQRVIMVRKGSGNTINEAFRVIRTNLELMTDAESSGAHTLMITSANPGSGKTFITMNLATVLAIKGKKVAIVDLDLRKASLSTFADQPQTGMSAYLSGHATPDQIRVRRPVEPPKHPEQFKGKELAETFVDIYPVGAL